MQKVILALICLLPALTCQAQIITVDDDGPPADFNNIQAAIDIAVLGDEIHVASGLYKESIIMKNGVNLYGGYDSNDWGMPCDPNANKTIIDANGLNNSVVYIVDVNVEIDGFTITNGLAEIGGGIYCENSNVSISKCIITENKTADGEDSHEDGTPGGHGSGIYCIYSSSLTISDCAISNNTTGRGGSSDGWGNGADGGSGAGIYCVQCSYLSLTRCLISGNTTGSGGRTDFIGEGSNWRAGSSGIGGGIYFTGQGTLELISCTVSGNATGAGGHSNALEAGNSGSGGGIYCSDSTTFILRTCNISDNRTGDGGCSSMWCNAVKSNIYELAQYRVGHGGHSGSGGGICFVGEGSLVCSSCTINNNGTGNGGRSNMSVGGNSGSGGGMYSLDSVRLALEDCEIYENSTGNGGYSFQGGDAGESGHGAGVYCFSVEMTSCNLAGNVIGNGGDTWQMSSGGGGGSGAGVYCASQNIFSQFVKCVFSSNTAGTGGWGNPAGSGGHGGGMYCLTGEIINCDFIENETGNGGRGYENGDAHGSPGGNGGGLYGNMLSVVGSQFFQNKTGNGGNGYVEFWSADGADAGAGGGIYCSDSNVSDCVVMANSTGNGGDAAGCDSGGGSGGDGAGICCLNSDISNCVIAANLSGNGGLSWCYSWQGGSGGDGGDGAGIKCAASRLSHCTLYGNVGGQGGAAGTGDPNPAPVPVPGRQGLGAGIYADAGSVINDTIIWDNSPEQLLGHDCNNVTFCDIQNGLCGSQLGNISADPCFADPNSGDYHLVSSVGRWDPSCQSWVYDDVNSPSIDAGDPNSDWTGELWPHGKRINMGAYGGTREASMSSSTVGNVGDLNCDDDVDFRDYASFASDWRGYNSLTIPRDKVVVDGDLSEWSDGVEWIKLNRVYHGSPNDVNEARFALRWSPDTNRIYVAVIVEDVDHMFQDYHGYWNDSDRLELYSQGDAAGGAYGANQDIAQQYIIAPDTNDSSWATLAYGEPNISGTGLEYAVTVNGDLIIYEIGVVQFDNYGVKSGGETIVTDLAIDHLVRFDVVVSTRHSEGFGMLSENTMTQKFKNADRIAQYTLVEKSERPSCLELKTDLDRNCITDSKDLMMFCENWLEQE